MKFKWESSFSLAALHPLLRLQLTLKKRQQLFTIFFGILTFKWIKALLCLFGHLSTEFAKEQSVCPTNGLKCLGNLLELSIFAVLFWVIVTTHLTPKVKRTDMIYLSCAAGSHLWGRTFPATGGCKWKSLFEVASSGQGSCAGFSCGTNHSTHIRAFTSAGPRIWAFKDISTRSCSQFPALERFQPTNGNEDSDHP